jgi:hypothetical protein
MAIAKTMKKVISTMNMTGLARRALGFNLASESKRTFPDRGEAFCSVVFSVVAECSSSLFAKSVHQSFKE